MEIADAEFEAECAAVTRWTVEFESILGKVPADYWISVIDYHR